MESFKLSLVAACTVGLVSAVINYICGDKYAPQLKLITSLILILTVSSQLVNGKLPEDMGIYEPDLEYLEQQTDKKVFDISVQNIVSRLKALYTSNGIRITDVSIDAHNDEYNYISVSAVRVYSDDENIDKDKLSDLTAGVLPDAGLTVIINGEQ